MPVVVASPAVLPSFTYSEPAAPVRVKVLVQVAVFPEESVTVTVTVVIPAVAKVPASGDCALVIGAVLQLSVAVTPAVKSGMVAVPQLAAEVLAGPHDVITGLVVSETVTVNEHGADTLPIESVAVNVFVVTPIGNTDPEGRPAV